MRSLVDRFVGKHLADAFLQLEWRSYPGSNQQSATDSTGHDWRRQQREQTPDLLTYPPCEVSGWAADRG